MALGQALGHGHEQAKDVEALKVASAEPFRHGAVGRVRGLFQSASRSKVNEYGPLGHLMQLEAVSIDNEVFWSCLGPLAQGDIGGFDVHVQESRHSLRNVSQRRKDLCQIRHKLFAILAAVA